MLFYPNMPAVAREIGWASIPEHCIGDPDSPWVGHDARNGKFYYVNTMRFIIVEVAHVHSKLLPKWRATCVWEEGQRTFDVFFHAATIELAKSWVRVRYPAAVFSDEDLHRCGDCGWLIKYPCSRCTRG